MEVYGVHCLYYDGTSEVVLFCTDGGADLFRKEVLKSRNPKMIEVVVWDSETSVEDLDNFTNYKVLWSADFSSRKVYGSF